MKRENVVMRTESEMLRLRTTKQQNAANNKATTRCEQQTIGLRTRKQQKRTNNSRDRNRGFSCVVKKKEENVWCARQ
jgi:hypothetical protein